ncbi:hypothetical protein BO94DRAFT_591176 [Aspergillus sclerotioniger CBS 115572]|uniref:Uncharacterized protein n=1 Tax=Aspergillus sclerotioniger CBS 115572 TaxID=1450535 RepID=A0A317UYU0_9EURO|nr:hypothetical protein BO94DRAFT_591176 [Aspergillus sclerotioniger CBS 115572]PWY66361.1 hypothetical protein BO94DRAFT_591176 [Aspergillus sclerotioniger CBS 115572]
MATIYKFLSLFYLLAAAVALPLETDTSVEKYQMSDEASWKAEIHATGEDPSPQADL